MLAGQVQMMKERGFAKSRSVDILHGQRREGFRPDMCAKLGRFDKVSFRPALPNFCKIGFARSGRPVDDCRRRMPGGPCGDEAQGSLVPGGYEEFRLVPVLAKRKVQDKLSP